MSTTLATALLLAALAAFLLARPTEAARARATPTPEGGWTVVSLNDGALD